jgi:acyl transferase domain-containing protein
LATAEQVTDPGYWAARLDPSARFDNVLEPLCDVGDLVLLELGPGQSLTARVLGRRDQRDQRLLAVQTLPAAADPRPAGTVLAEALGRLWLAGVQVDWDGYQRDRPVAKTGLPGYVFQRDRYWIDPPAAGRAAAPAAGRAVSAAPAVSAAAAGRAGPPVDAGHVQLMRPVWSVQEHRTGVVEVGRCILLTDGSEVASAVAGALRGDGVDVVQIRHDAGAGDAAVVRQLADQDRTTLVDLRLLDDDDDNDDDDNDDNDDNNNGGGDNATLADGWDPVAGSRSAVLSIAATLDALGSCGALNTRVVVATRGGHAVGAGESPLPEHAVAGALAVVANQEYLNLGCQVVDLDPGGDPAAAAGALTAELRHEPEEVLAAYRHGRRLVREFLPAGPVAAGPAAGSSAAGAGNRPAAVPVRPGGTYLITGGLGGVGLLLAEHLAGAGAGRLVLTSRTGVPGLAGERAERLTRIRELGVDLLTPVADVSDRTAMAGVVADLLRDGGRLDGVIHAAAQTSPGSFRPLRDLTGDVVDQHHGEGRRRRARRRAADLPPGRHRPAACCSRRPRRSSAASPSAATPRRTRPSPRSDSAAPPGALPAARRPDGSRSAGTPGRAPCSGSTAGSARRCWPTR